MRSIWIPLVAGLSALAFDSMEDASADLGAYDDPYGMGYGGGGYEDPYGYGGYGVADRASSIKQLSSSDELKSWILENSDRAHVIGYFDDTAKEDIEVFNQVADAEESKLKFAMTTSKDILEELSYSGSVVFVYPPAKYIQSDHERSKYRYPSKKLSKDSLTTFVRSKSLPLVGELNFETESLYTKHALPVLTLFLHLDFKMDDKNFAFYFKRLVKVMKLFSLFLNLLTRNLDCRRA